MFETASWLPLVSRTLIVGVFGGAGLVLTQIYSRRGPLIFPVYAALLAALALVSARFRELPFTAHFAAALTGMLVATAISFAAVLVLGSRERQTLRESGRPLAPGGAPWWGLPLVLLIVVVASAAVAYVSSSPRRSEREASAGIDSLNVRLAQAYRSRDPQTYAALFTDSAVFEWPAFNTVRGRAGLEAMARTNWASLNDMDLRLHVSSRRVQSNHATEFGAFEQSWRDSSGTRMTEFGRYVAVLSRQGDSSWRIDRFFGFADSTRPLSARP